MLAALWMAPSVALAADPVVEWSAELTPGATRGGEHVTLEVTAKVPEHWHLYSMNRVADGPKPLSLEVGLEGLQAAGPWYGPAPKVEFDPNFKTDVEFFEGTVTHERAFAIEGLGAGTHSLEVVARGQICDPQTCISLKETLSVEFEVGEGEARGEFAAPPKHDGQAFDPEAGAAGEDTGAEAGSESGELSEADKLDPDKVGLIQFLIGSFVAGLLALLTPCVFPMIPITIAFFTKHAESSRKRSLLMAGTYSGAIVVCFTLMGVGASLIFGASAMQNTASSPAFNVFMFLLLFVFGLSLLGLFEISAPRFLVDKSAELEQKYGDEGGSLGRQVLGVFFMGLTFSLMSFTCTVGLVGVLFAQLEGGEHWLYPTMGLFMFAVAFSLPFFLLALFPAAAKRLQGKAGDWMFAFKVTLGFLELAGAFKFLSNIDLYMGWFMITRPVVLMVWVGLFLACGLFLWRLIKFDEYDEVSHVSVPRMLAGAFFVAFGLYAASGFSHSRSMGGWIDAWLPPAVMPDAVAEGGEGEGKELAWIKDDIEGALAQGKVADQPVFIDFTGYQCTNCRMMESSVFPRPNIDSRLRQMTLGQAYTDCREAVCEQQQTYQKQTFHTVALPFYAIYDPYTGEAIETFASSTNDHREFEAFLQSGLDKYAAAKAIRVAPAPAIDGAGDHSGGAGTGVSDSGEGDSGKQGDSGETGAVTESPFAGVSAEQARVGEAVDFELPTLGGEKYSFASDRGGWVLVNFWASWCAPCKHELEHEFPSVFTAHSELDLVTVAFDGEEMVPTLEAFLEKVGLDEHTALLGGEEADEAGLPEVFAVGSGQIPQTYLIDPEGYVVWSRVGSVDAALLERVLAAPEGE